MCESGRNILAKHKKKPFSIKKKVYKQKKRQRAAFARRAIIAAGELRFRVRHGNGHVLPAIAAASYHTHGPREPRELHISSNPTLPEHSMQRANICARQASRAIGAPRLCTSRCLRLASIHRVYFPGPFMEHVQRRTDPGAGFALRCSQRLSVPRAAARPWDWRPNRCTVASSPPVLAYWGGIP